MSAQNYRIGFQPEVFQNADKDEIQVGVAAVSFGNHLFEFLAVELIASVPCHFLFEYLKGADNFLFETHFAVVCLFRFRAEWVGEGKVFAELCIFRFQQLVVYIFPFLAVWLVFVGGKLRALQVETYLHLVVFRAPAVGFVLTDSRKVA